MEDRFPAVWRLRTDEQSTGELSIAGDRVTNPADAAPDLAPIGPFLDPVELEALTGWGEQPTRRRRARGQVFAVRVGRHHYYPRWQFTDSGQVRDGLVDVFKALVEVDARTAGHWLVTPNGRLEGSTPREAAMNRTTAKLAFEAASQAVEDLF